MTLELRLKGETQILGTRLFAAPPARVYEAHMNPDLIRKWMLGPPGWQMPVCDWDIGPERRIRCRWEMGEEWLEVTGHIIATERPHRIEHVERFHMPDPTPDNHIVTTFTEDGSGTRMDLVMTLPDKDTREAMLATGMEEGMEASYARLDGTA